MKKYDDVNRWYESVWKNAVAEREIEADALRELRENAISAFTAMQFPTRKDEEWKYTPIDPLLKLRFKPAFNVDSTVSEEVIAKNLYNADDYYAVVFVNGRFREEFSSLPDAESGLIVAGLKEAIEKYTDDVFNYLSKYASYDENIFTALGTAFIDDGVFIKVNDNIAADKPLQILYFTDAAAELLTSPRNLVLLGKNAELKFIEIYNGTENTNYLTNAVTEISLDANAQCEHSKVQRESVQSFHISRTEVKQKRDSRYIHLDFNFGSLIARNDINALFEESGAECNLYGVSVQHGRQVIDNHTLIDHAVPHCESNEMYKAVLNDDARGVFNGKVMVRPNAQKTNAFQENKTILLSERALMNTKPQLEIYADDVKCSHGATIGQLDKEALFYLQSRGLGKELARIMLINAFAADVLSNLSIDSVREALANEIAESLSK